MESIKNNLFPKSFKLLDGIDEIFELDFAYWEYKTLSSIELIKRSGFFEEVEKRKTNHYLLCNLQRNDEIYKNSSFRTRLFFQDGKYSTGYATHSLFPYRGKFHPQLIRGLLNVLQVKENETVLDPMAGSGTLLTEANLLNINAIGVDISPFCKLMSDVKTKALNINQEFLDDCFKRQEEYFDILSRIKSIDDFLVNQSTKSEIYKEIILLGYLDAVGFSRRSKKDIEILFPKVIERYYKTIKYFNEAREKITLKIGLSKFFIGDARNLNIEDNSIDCVITSPPYSFAIDYIENDKPQLLLFDKDIDQYKSKMIGMRGRGIEQKLSIYFNDIKLVLSELKRVTKEGKKIVIIVGSNTIQTKGVKLEPEIILIGKEIGLKVSSVIGKPIKGLNSSMREESIIIFEK